MPKSTKSIKVFSKLIQYAWNYRIWFISSLVAAVLLSALSSLKPILSKNIIDDHILQWDYQGLIRMSIKLLIVLIAEVIMEFSYVFLANWIGQQIIKDIRKKIFEKLLSFQLKYYDKTPVGKVVTRVVSDIDKIAEVFSQGLFTMFGDLLKMIVLIAVMFTINPILSTIVLCMLPVFLYITRIFQKAIKSSFQEVRNQVTRLNTFVQERISGMTIIQSFGRAKSEQNKFKHINKAHKDAHLRTVWHFSIFFPITEFISSITIALIIWYGGLNAIINKSVTLGELTAFISVVQIFFRPLRQLADKFNTLQLGMISAERVIRIIEQKENIEQTGTLQLDQLKGQISFNKVDFSYNPEEQILNQLSFHVNPGEMVALIGATGAGKSTIINLINRLYSIDAGSIQIDNHNIEDFELANLRKHITIVLQDVFLFSDTILKNITLGKDIPLEKVIACAKETKIHDFIMSLPNNYEYKINERGTTLSVGQRQLLAFLRAYICNPNILILDEATSNIDTSTEQLLEQVIQKLTKNRTSIIIAHRLNTIKKADKIFVMDQGKIVEEGRHQNLIKENGIYSKLYNAQFSKISST